MTTVNHISNLIEARKTALAFLFKGDKSTPASMLNAAKVIRGEITKAVKDEASVYGKALRTHKKIVLINLDGTRVVFGVEADTPWTQVAVLATKSMGRIMAWAHWMQRAHDICKAPDSKARRLIADHTKLMNQPNCSEDSFRKIARFLDMPADVEVATKASELLKADNLARMCPVQHVEEMRLALTSGAEDLLHGGEEVVGTTTDNVALMEDQIMDGTLVLTKEATTQEVLEEQCELVGAKGPQNSKVAEAIQILKDAGLLT
jgi:hypothetical protein